MAGCSDSEQFNFKLFASSTMSRTGCLAIRVCVDLDVTLFGHSACALQNVVKTPRATVPVSSRTSRATDRQKTRLTLWRCRQSERPACSAGQRCGGDVVKIPPYFLPMLSAPPDSCQTYSSVILLTHSASPAR
jgi:hypothetical protein